MAVGDIHLGAHRPLDPNFKLFEAEDGSAWAIFVFVFLALLFIDNALIFSKPRSMSFATAVFYTLFWGSTAVMFCVFVGWWQGAHSAYMWLSGYTLQWMMSFDNLFVFHLVFKVYCTPDKLKHRPLFLGILGQAAITFTLLTVGEYLFHTFLFLHLVFGAFFIYIGICAATGDDEDDDPTQNPFIQWLQSNLPFVSIYDTEGHFFVRLPVDGAGKVFIPDCAKVNIDTCMETDSADAQKRGDAFMKSYSLIDLSKIDLYGQKTELRATMLCLVVLTMEISDVIFSVDTIVAVSVQVGDLFLAFTCVAFALLTLRATFFIVEVLVQMFSLMKYGIAAILIYIGIKLVIDRFYVVPLLVDCVVIVGTFVLTIVASAIYDKVEDAISTCGSPAPSCRAPAEQLAAEQLLAKASAPS
jgi:tellurite resistance protein TerC